MPIVNGNYYMNGEYGQGLEQARIGDAFPGLADQSGAGNSWVDRLIDHLTTPRSATEPPPAPAPPEMPPEAYDDMKINQLTVRQVANVVANEDRNVTRGLCVARGCSTNRSSGRRTLLSTGIEPLAMTGIIKLVQRTRKLTPELENSAAYQQALKAARQAFQEQLAGKDPTGGRIWFNNRFTASTGPRAINKKDPEHSTVGVNRVFGPYEYKHKPIYTDVDEI